MEIKEHLSVYLESGYLFDDMSGKLKWFEIDKILISFTYGVVRYVGTWGGCRAEKTLDGKLFYSSEECFKKGNSIPKTKLSIYDVFESLYGFVLIGDVWKYKNGRAVKDKLEYFDIEIDDKGKIYCKETYYRTREDVYKFNDLLSDFSPYNRNKGKMQELRHKFRNQILEYWGEDTGILIGITMVHERHLWNEEVKVI